MSSTRRRVAQVAALAVAATGLPLLTGAAPTALAASPDLVISQVYGGGGNSGATYTNDFVQLFNRGTAPVDLTGHSVQYASATGTGTFQPAAISGTLQPGQSYLVQLAGGTNGVPLPVAADATGTLNLSGSTGKVIVASQSAGVPCNGGSDPCTAAEAAAIVDLVGYGTANFFEGAAQAPGLSATTAAQRIDGGCTDTDQNATDFVAAAPDPRNTASPLAPCDGPPTDAAPSVTSISPADGASSVSVDAAVTVTFSEDVTVAADWLALTCATAGAVTGVTTGGPAAYTFDPASSLPNGDTCTVTIAAGAVTDVDTTDPPDTMTAGFSSSFSTIAADPCAAPITSIPAIQGNGATTPRNGTVVTTRGVVVSDDEGPSPALRGFNLQDPAGDGDATTSDGIFVFNGANTDLVSVGDVVTVTGRATEFGGQTQIDQLSSVVVCGTGTVAPTDVTLPVPDLTFLERYEGMLVRMPQELTVTEHFQLARFGEVVVSSGGRLFTPTNVVAPGAPAIALQDLNNRNRIVVDDNRSDQNPSVIRLGRGGQPLSASNTLRAGDSVTGMVAVMSFSFSAYRLMPFNALGGGAPDFQPTNPRPETPPDVGGRIQVAGMNVLNYFNTFDPGCRAGVAGPPTDCRGADDAAEFARQVPKTVAAIVGTGAEVIGINEIENDGYGPDSAIAQLVGALNDATAPGTYAFIDADARTGQIDALGSDAIKVGFIYQPGAVSPAGTTAVLNTVEFVNGGDSGPRNRAALAQTFVENATGGAFTAVVNHLKSKGSACDAPDAGDGQGNCNQVRVNAVNRLLEWLATNPTSTSDTDVLLVGDLNAYAKEDPITTLQAAGYTNLVDEFVGPGAYSYVFGAQSGYLDHLLGSPSLVGQVTGVGEWHINADEPPALDYNTNFKPANLITELYAPDQYRMSDHDAALIGLDLVGPTLYEVRANGKITSPAGSSVADPSASGRANISVKVRMTERDTVTGHFTFVFPDAQLTVVGRDLAEPVVFGGTATIQGAAKINGEPGSTFVATLVDGSPDRFRLVVRDAGGAVTYDSGDQTLTSGSVEIDDRGVAT